MVGDAAQTYRVSSQTSRSPLGKEVREDEKLLVVGGLAVASSLEVTVGTNVDSVSIWNGDASRLTRRVENFDALQTNEWKNKTGLLRVDLIAQVCSSCRSHS